MKVRALKKHCNDHGETFWKKKGCEYEHPSPRTDLALSIIEEVKAEDMQGEEPVVEPKKRKRGTK